MQNFRAANTDLGGGRTTDREVGLCTWLHSRLRGKAHTWGQAWCVLGQVRMFIILPHHWNSFFSWRFCWFWFFRKMLARHKFPVKPNVWVSSCIFIIYPALQPMLGNNSLYNLIKGPFPHLRREWWRNCWDARIATTLSPSLLAYLVVFVAIRL